MRTLEVCLDNIESVRIVDTVGGVERLELCSALALGGLSPSPALVSYARERTGMGLHAMVRPRSGDFCFDVHDIEAMVDEIGYFADLGAHGVVIGVLNDDFTVNRTATEQLCAAAKFKGLEVTFHRAVDFTPNYDLAIETLIELGVDRILTSGRSDTALLGADNIAAAVKKYGDRITLMAGAGVTPGNAAEIVEKTGVADIHCSASSRVNNYADAKMTLGGASGDLEYQITDTCKLEAVKAALGL